MFKSIGKAIFGTANDRILKKIDKHVQQINDLRDEYAALTDSQLQAKTAEFKQQLQNGATLDDILPQAFATVREAATRTLGITHYDVQLIGGYVLHKGMVAEMKTGEGKTLVATLPAYLNALTGQGVHMVTVNDYLAARDAEWMGQIYKFLGLTVGCLTANTQGPERYAAYEADITYGTNNEFGFDYLRDNLKLQKQDIIQKTGFNFAVVDEVDSILIDEARTPLIISGPTEDNSELYYKINKLIPSLKAEDYEIDEKAKSATLSDKGVESMEQLLKANNLLPQGGLYDMQNVSLVHHANQALKAHKLFERDKDYLVQNNQVMLIDEFTGRVQDGRRYSEGLHQALEAKEDVPIQNENQTLASVTYQNYFRMYNKLAGMTGTASTEAEELGDIYGLEVVEIPTHVPVARKDDDDEIYRTSAEKYKAIIEEIIDCQKRGQPVLVGTVSVESSESLSKALKAAKISHSVLNAKHHDKEAEIIANAGEPGAVTIATNMAGRGTDIKLGGNEEVKFLKVKDKYKDYEYNKAKLKIEREVKQAKQQVLDAGGLYVLGTERHESRRIDNQLRGRSGRQGDPGKSKFFLSLEDDLMRIFGADRIDGILQKLGMQEGEAITHPWVSKALQTAQKKVEARNYDIRKNVLKFDDVMNDQRSAIYDQRLDIMESEDVSENIKDMQDAVINNIVFGYMQPNMDGDIDADGMRKELGRVLAIDFPIQDWLKSGWDSEQVADEVNQAFTHFLKSKADAAGVDTIREIERQVMMLTLDQLWKEHLHSLDHLRQGIYLRAYGNKDPLREYKEESFKMFGQMLDELQITTIQRLAHIDPTPLSQEEFLAHEAKNQQEVKEGAPAVEDNEPKPFDKADPSTWGKVPRNAPCPCGSGKKYKHCHGKL